MKACWSPSHDIRLFSHEGVLLRYCTKCFEMDRVDWPTVVSS